jgi:hypothetical protein
MSPAVVHYYHVLLGILVPVVWVVPELGGRAACAACTQRGPDLAPMLSALHRGANSGLSTSQLARRAWTLLSAGDQGSHRYGTAPADPLNTNAVEFSAPSVLECREVAPRLGHDTLIVERTGRCNSP